MSLLTAEGVVSGYGQTEILHGISIRVEDGEFVTIIGPNGSGKSTLLKTIFGLLKPSDGRIAFDGRNITGSPPEQMVRLGLSYVPQAANVFPNLTVQENLEMGAFSVPGDFSDRMDDMYGLFPPLADRRSLHAGKLSGGQRQMLAFARAMMLDPKVLLLDEPSAGLSPAMVGQVFDNIKAIHSSGVSVLIVEQNARQALSQSDRGYVLVAGENRLESTGQRLLNDPEVARLYLGG